MTGSVRSTGVAVHRAARICAIAHGGQVLLSRATAGVVDDEDVSGLRLRDLGEHRLKDFDRPERVYELVVDGLRFDFPPLRGELSLRDLGEVRTRRGGELVRAYELVGGRDVATQDLTP